MTWTFRAFVWLWVWWWARREMRRFGTILQFRLTLTHLGRTWNMSVDMRNFIYNNEHRNGIYRRSGSMFGLLGMMKVLRWHHYCPSLCSLKRPDTNWWGSGLLGFDIYICIYTKRNEHVILLAWLFRKVKYRVLPTWRETKVYTCRHTNSFHPICEQSLYHQVLRFPCFFVTGSWQTSPLD